MIDTALAACRTAARATIHAARLKLSARRGRTKRLFMEGRRLEDTGFLPGAAFEVDIDRAASVVRIRLAEAGPRKVSRKASGGRWIPVIDLCSATLDEFFGDGTERISVRFSQGEILVSAAERDRARSERLSRLARRIAGERPLVLGSVFHGIGVLDDAIASGLAEAGVATELGFAIEREAAYLDAAIANGTRPARAVLSDVFELERDDLPERVDVLIGGLPCTGASQANTAVARAEDHDEAGHLFLPFLQIVDWCAPSVVIVENVPPYAETVGYAMILRVLANRGYAVTSAVLDGRDFGALEARQRLCMVATTAREGAVPFDLASLPRQPAAQRLGDVLEPLAEDDPRWRRFDSVWDRVERTAGRLRFKPRVMRPDDDHCPTLTRGYSKVRAYDPFLAHPSDPTLMRQFTPVEHARIKTVPERLIAGLPATLAHQGLGQGVIHSAFRAVGRALGSWLAGAVPRDAAAPAPVPAATPPVARPAPAARKPRAPQPLDLGALPLFAKFA